MIKAGSAQIVIAGGMESMSNAPYMILKGRQGMRLGHSLTHDHMMLDGLEDAYDKGKAMGCFAEQCVSQYQFTREQQDDFATASFTRALESIQKKQFNDEIIPLTISTKTGEKKIDTDEHPGSVNPEKIPRLNPVFSSYC